MQPQGGCVLSLAIMLAWCDMVAALPSTILLNDACAGLCRMQELRLAKVMAEGRHLVMMLDPTQQHNQQLHLHMAAQPVSPCMAVQEAHAARVMCYLASMVQACYLCCCLCRMHLGALAMPCTTAIRFPTVLSLAPAMSPHCTALLQVAKRQLAQAHLWLVFKVVSAYQRQKLVCTDDLVQAGLHGLDTALDKFDPGRGNRLSTVAYMWIKDAVGRAYNQLVGTIKVSERTRRNVGQPFPHSH